MSTTKEKTSLHHCTDSLQALEKLCLMLSEGSSDSDENVTDGGKFFLFLQQTPVLFRNMVCWQTIRQKQMHGSNEACQGQYET